MRPVAPDPDTVNFRGSFRRKSFEVGIPVVSGWNVPDAGYLRAQLMIALAVNAKIWKTSVVDFRLRLRYISEVLDVSIICTSSSIVR